MLNQIIDRRLAVGNILWLSLGPVKGSEQGGKRPVIILSEQQANWITGRVVVVPCTTKAREWITEIAITSLPQPSVALIDQIQTLDWRARNAEFRGQAVSAKELYQIKASIKAFLNL